ncbi:calcium-binding protein [Tateyamaria sp. ANG-S1]|uniref:calcium-binding protein n=1 Tax=Tateyamaria sp. ANG-S1 TaxID=1577905 RepID=UPI00068EF5CB|nr:calcium-binding protein [Tateyamaria sp. ANG-S1]
MTTTYTIEGVAISGDFDDDIGGSITPATLSITFADEVASLLYAFSGFDDFLPGIEFTSPAAISATLNGVELDDIEAGGFSFAETLLGQLDWSQGRSTLLDFFFENPSTEQFVDYIFVISGPDIPFGTSEDDFFSFLTSEFPQLDNPNLTDDQLDDLFDDLFAPAAGAFAQGVEIPLDIISWDSVLNNAVPIDLTGTSGDDELVGDSAADRLDGLAGDDTLNGGDGADTLIGGAGNDSITGGTSTDDLRDIVFGGAGDDTIDGGYGNDELRGDAGNDSIAGGFGADTVIGGAGDDTLTGSAFGDLIFGSDGFDFINGGFGSDRVNGGADGDRFFHLGIADHGSDWIQDYNAAEGDVLVYGGNATRDQFQVNVTNTANAGADDVDEAFVIYRPTGQILWALVDGDGQSEINIRIGGQEFDLLA